MVNSLYNNVHLSLHTAPLSVSEISQPCIIYAQMPTDLQCTIQGATRPEVRLKWYKLRRGEDLADQSDSVSLLVSEELSDQACLRSDGNLPTSVLTVRLAVRDDLNTYRCVVVCRGRSFVKETTVSVKTVRQSTSCCGSPHCIATEPW